MNTQSRPSFREALDNLTKSGGYHGAARLYFDGGLGTMLQSRGLPAGVSPEQFCLQRPDVLLGIHADYAVAGSDVVTTNTFGGTSFKLPAGIDAVEFNRKMAEIARQAADRQAAVKGRPVYVAGSIGPTGKFLAPLGELSFPDLVRAFEEQIRGLVQGGADLIMIETQIDLAEARAAVVACRRVCTLPVGVSMTFEEGATLTGSGPEVCVATLLNMGVDFLGTNCSAGPEQLRETVARILAASTVPVLVQPNAGLPELVDGETVFRLAPERFAELTAVFAESGAMLLGGCCGTTPAHIAALKQATEQLPSVRPNEEQAGCISLTTRSRLVNIGLGHEFALIGERINPTGKKQLSQELVAGETAMALHYAVEQLEAGAAVLDVNVGAPMVDETVALPALVSLLSSRYQVPLSLDSSNPEAIRAALEFCPASPLVNSISGEPGRMELLGPLCRDFGAPFILLPLRGKHLPVLASERIGIVEALLEEMDSLGIPRRLAMVDILVLSVSAKPEAALECLKFIHYCSETLRLPTTAGLSNISFGLPARDLVNATFLGMAAASGLNAAIANPGTPRIREAVAASRLLLGQDKDAAAFISGYSGWTSGSSSPSGIGSSGGGNAATPSAVTEKKDLGIVKATLEQAVIKGLREEVLSLVESALAAGQQPFEIVNEQLIPGITEVGAMYERKEYFLPQLLRSAETMQTAFARLKPLLEQDGRADSRPRVVMATVEGDIHDIGKNIVNLMLGNHGFEVIDLGKDVSADKIVRAAEENGARLIGLSALMTTTMVRMRDTVDLLKERNLRDVKVMIGGAVVTGAFAESIGAHGFALDAAEAVKVAQRLLLPKEQ